jgi:hypothetical protein
MITRNSFNVDSYRLMGPGWPPNVRGLSVEPTITDAMDATNIVLYLPVGPEELELPEQIPGR